MVVHIFNPSSLEEGAEAGRVGGQLGVYSKILFQERKEEERKRKGQRKEKERVFNRYILITQSGFHQLFINVRNLVIYFLTFFCFLLKNPLTSPT